jgi:hypothetical protein
VVAVPHCAAPNMIRPAFAPVPTASEAVSPAALMLTVAVPAANAQLTAPSAGAGAATTAPTVASAAIQRQGRIILRDDSALAATDPSCREGGRPDTGSKTKFHDDAHSPVAPAPSSLPTASLRRGSALAADVQSSGYRPAALSALDEISWLLRSALSSKGGIAAATRRAHPPPARPYRDNIGVSAPRGWLAARPRGERPHGRRPRASDRRRRGQESRVRAATLRVRPTRCLGRVSAAR